MSTLGNITVDGGKTLGGILQEGRLRVPANQREFSWKRTHVRELFQDIKPIIEDRSGQEYFLGTVVVLRDPENRADLHRTVVDGPTTPGHCRDISRRSARLLLQRKRR